MSKFMKALAAIMLLIMVFNAGGCKKQEKDSVKPEVETSSISNITETSAIGGGVVTSEGSSSIIERGVCWSKEHNPEVSDFHIIVGGSVGSFTCTLVDLESNTTYYLRAYAINNIGITYGSEISFVTLQNSNLPIVTISQVTEITSSTAMCQGSIIDSGGSPITEKGFCWNTNGNPTLDDNNISICWTDSFYGYILNLEPNTTYYVRAYATNDEGVGYSQETSFTTSVPPTISTFTGEGFIGEGDVIELDTEYKFGFTMASPIGLSSLCVDVAIDDYSGWTELTNINISGFSEYIYIDSVSVSLAKDIIGELIIRATVKDVNGESSKASFTVRIDDDSSPLIIREFEWIRQGYQPGTGLEEFGLCWDSNAKTPHAQIKPLEGVSLYALYPSVWEETITETQKLAALLEIGMIITVYGNVDVMSSNNYNDVIGTIMPDGTCHLLHITRCNVSNDYYTKITISGEAK